MNCTRGQPQSHTESQNTEARNRNRPPHISYILMTANKATLSSKVAAQQRNRNNLICILLSLLSPDICLVAVVEPQQRLWREVSIRAVEGVGGGNVEVGVGEVYQHAEGTRRRGGDKEYIN
mgnify:CR=1 FL=1